MWLVMSRDVTHTSGEWAFNKCLWSPSRKRDRTKWAYWESLLHTRENDMILHLRGKGKTAAFVGISYAASDGFETTARPPSLGQWAYADNYYRVFLEDYSEFDYPIFLHDIFETRAQLLIDFFNANRSAKANDKLRLFYVLQNGKLRCLNGAYLSQVNLELAKLLLPSENNLYQISLPKDISLSAQTGESYRQLLGRIGQDEFSKMVRNNYDSQCCFPDCPVHEDRFLIGAHIARWADTPEFRGEITNGLCVCLMHDKAFETGLFTIAQDLTIFVNLAKCKSSKWAEDNLIPFHKRPMRLGKILPSLDALEKHWKRTGITP